MNNTASGNQNTSDYPVKSRSCYYLDRFQIFETEPLGVHYIVNCSLNAVLSVVAILGNAMILHALLKSSAFRLPSRAFLFSLALSDLSVGLVVQPLYIIYKAAEINNNHGLYCTAGVAFHLSANIFSAVSFLTVVSIALDRLLALQLGAKYQSTVSLRRVTVVILFLWALTSLWVFTWLRSIRLYQVFNIAATSVCLFVCLATYARLWLRIRKLNDRTVSRWKLEGQVDIRSTNDLKLRNYKRSVMSMFYVYILLLVCYTPYLAMFIVIETSKVNFIKISALSYSITILFANSSLNPFLYCWRIREIRQEVYFTLSKFRFCRKK